MGGVCRAQHRAVDLQRDLPRQVRAPCAQGQGSIPAARVRPCSDAALGGRRRDTSTTEKLDYLSGNAVVVYSLWCAIVRTTAWRERWKWAYTGALMGGVLACHWLYMLGIKFDYGWNMLASLVAGASQAVVWAVWAARAKPPFRSRLLLFWLGLHLLQMQRGCGAVNDAKGCEPDGGDHVLHAVRACAPGRS